MYDIVMVTLKTQYDKLPELITLQEFGDYFKLQAKTIRSYCKRGFIRFYRVRRTNCGKIVIPKTEILLFSWPSRRKKLYKFEEL
jgi:hypothetical protein